MSNSELAERAIGRVLVALSAAVMLMFAFDLSVVQGLALGYIVFALSPPVRQYTRES
jgi:hypothetical protein